jgi:ribosomal protein S3
MKGIKVQVSGRLNGAEIAVNGNEMVVFHYIL